MTTRSTARGAEALFVGSFTYALTGILVREIAPMWGNNSQVTARYLVVCVMLASLYLFEKKHAKIPRAKWPNAVGLAILFPMMVIFFTDAIQRTTVANTLFTFYATNLIGSFLLGSIIFRESITPSKVAALVLTLAGLSVYAQALLDGNLGLLYSLISGVCGALMNVFSKSLAGVDRNAVLRVQYGIGTLVTLAVTFLSGEQIIKHVSLKAGILTIIFGFVIIVGANLALYGFQNFDVNVGTVIMSMEIIFAAIMAYFLFDEAPKTHELIGGILIFAGSVLGSGFLANKKQRGSEATLLAGQRD